MDSCNIKVAIKARPLNPKELLDNKVYWKIENDSVIHIDPVTKKKNGEQFFFDRVFCTQSTNYEVFDEIVRPIIDRGVQGFNGTVFAYGQTASGKTYTMAGDESNPGIIPLAINYMFHVMNSSIGREYLLRACYLEIYNEKVIDLLEQKDGKNERKRIQIQKDGLHITPLKAIVCQNAQMVIDLMTMGEKNRSIGETNMNERSSRSHTIFRIILESRNIDDDCDGAYQQSVINLVDLAGSERSIQQQSSIERFKEGCKINSSLTTLGLVIQQLSECPDSPQHINFRDSKLTRILQTSLGGNALTAIICTVTLAVDDQTNNTISFASRAKKIKNTAKVNENITDETLLKRYRVQLSKLNKELEGMKQNQFGYDEVNEIKHKYQKEKQTNEELKERIMRLQNNMITSEKQRDKPSIKKGYNRRRTWGGKLDYTFFSNSILETIGEDEDINMPRPSSVPSNFGNLNKEFKTPLEPFELDLIRAEDYTENFDDNEFSPPSGIAYSICNTPKKVLRERVNNYKSMFELSIKENNELREFTTLEKQMFHEHNEQLKDLSNLRNQINDLQREKIESAKMIETLKCSVTLVENEKRDIEVIMEMQKCKYEKRESELLTTIQETRDELKLKEEQLNKYLLIDTSIVDKQEEIKKLEIKVKEMSEINSTYINEIEILKSQILNKDMQLNEELNKHTVLMNELIILQNHMADVQSIPYINQFLADKGYFTLRKYEVEELDRLLEHIYITVEQLQQENQKLMDENSNLKLITVNYNNQINNIKIENDRLRSEYNLIEESIKSVVKDFSASSEIDVDNSDIIYLIEFAVTYFEQNTDRINKLSNENLILKEDLSISNNKISEIKSLFMTSTTEIEKYKKEHSETIKENIFLKSNINAFDKLTFECIQIVEQIKTNQSNFINLKEELNICNAIKIDFQKQIEQLNILNNSLESLVKTQTKAENEIKKELHLKSVALKEALIKLDETQMIINDNQLKIVSNADIVCQLNNELQSVQLNLDDKSNLIIELQKENLNLSNKYNELDKCYQSNINIIDQQKCIEYKLQDELVMKSNELQKSLEELKEKKIRIELSESEIEKLKFEIENIKSELDIKLKEKDISINQINGELLIKTKELENVLPQIITLESLIVEMNIKIDSNTNNTEKLIIELDNMKCEKSKLIKEFENNNFRKINELNDVIDNLKSKLEENLNKEENLKNELQFIIGELNDVIILMCKVESIIDVLNGKCESNNYIIDQLNNELECVKSTVNEKINLIVKLENVNLELISKCKNLDDKDQSYKIIDLERKLEEKTKIENDLRSELQVLTISFENALIKENEVQSLINSMKNELKLNIATMEQYKSELAIKSNLLAELEDKNSKLLKCSESNDIYYRNIQCQLETVTNEKILLQVDFNLINQQFLEISKHHKQTKFNLKSLLQEFNCLSFDIESLFKLKMDTECNLKKDIFCKSTELNDLQKQLYESNVIQKDYEKLEEEYMIKMRELNETQETILKLKSIISTKEESEKILKDNIKLKSIALEESKKNLEYVFNRNDSFQIRVNDFEENVLVDLNEELDSMKTELIKRTESEKTLLEEKLKLEGHLNELQENLVNVTKKLEHNEERLDDLVSVINVLEIEIKNANYIKDSLEYHINEAEHDLLKSGDFAENLEYELYIMQKEFNSLCNKAKYVERELLNIESKFPHATNDNVNRTFFDSLVDYVHDIKLILTELNSTLISGNQKLFRTKITSNEDNNSMLNTNSEVEIFTEFNLHKTPEGKIDTTTKIEIDRKKNNDLQDQIKYLSDQNNKLIDDKTLMENNLKEQISLVDNLRNELNQVKKQYIKLEEYNQATNEQIQHSLDIDLELRNGKKKLINEINYFESGKITGQLNHHNLSNLFDMFVNLIMTKEKQVITDLVNDHNKDKQHMVDQIKQFEEDIKKEKEWQKQVENDNEKLCLEIEYLKSQRDNFPIREIEIKDLTEKVLDAENKSFNYLCELQELKTQISETSKQNYIVLSNEFETFKITSEQSKQDLKEKLDDLTKKYNESLSKYNNQKNSHFNLVSQIEKIQSECICLKAIIDKKDEDIKNLNDKNELKEKEYKMLIEKNSLQRQEMINIHEKKIDELQLELNEKIQKIYSTEKLVKEITKKYNQVIEENSTKILKIQSTQETEMSTINKLENLEKELQVKSKKIEDIEAKSLKYIHELEDHKLKLIICEKQLESCYQALKLKDDQINTYEIKWKINVNDAIETNNTIEKLGKILDCAGTLSTIYENVSILINKYKSFENEIEELKFTNKNLDSECESMLIEIKSKDNMIMEYITKEDKLKQNVKLLEEERDFFKIKCAQFNTANDDIKKLNDELSNYEQNIYQLRKEKGQFIIQHDKELKEVKLKLNEVQIKNLELLDNYNKLTEYTKNVEKSLKEDIQQLNRCIVDKNAKISTLELFSKTNSDELKKRNLELEDVFKRVRNDNHMLRKELRHFKEVTNVKKSDQYTQTADDQSIVSSAMMAGHKSMIEKINKLENDNHLMKRMLHHRKLKIEGLQKQLGENH